MISTHTDTFLLLNSLTPYSLDSLFRCRLVALDPENGLQVQFVKSRILFKMALRKSSTDINSPVKNDK